MIQGWILIDSFPLFLWQVESKGGEVVLIGGVYYSDQISAMLDLSEITDWKTIEV